MKTMLAENLVSSKLGRGDQIPHTTLVKMKSNDDEEFQNL